MQSDLDVEEEEQRERGVEEARHAALRAFGNPSLISEQTRTVWSWNALEHLFRDVRIGIRTLFRSHGFSLIAIVIMALCIGATTHLRWRVVSLKKGVPPVRLDIHPHSSGA